MTSTPLPPLIGDSLALRRVVALIERYAPTPLPMFVVGPTGTGKELVARHIHAKSGRPGRFVPVNCGALPREMAESLLFGHRRGAFSGAVESRVGHVGRADRGTLFLDEIHCLPMEGQTKLLRALDTGEIQPLGEDSERIVDLRVVAAAHDEVWADVRRGEVRLDLYQRIAGVIVFLPPLAERPQDIVPIAAHFAGLAGRRLEQGAEDVLERHTWPGNVRELRQTIDRAGCLVENGTLPPAAIAEAIHLGLPGGYRAPCLTRDEWLNVAIANEWDPRRMARALGIGRSWLYARLRASGISLRRLRQSTASSGRPLDRVDLRVSNDV